MKTTITIIIILIYVISHVVSALAKQAAKRKEQERQRQMAERRRIEAGGALTPPTLPGAKRVDPMFGGSTGTLSPTPVPGSRRIGTPADDLAARRREQIDQLRQRREGRRAGQAAQPRSTAPARPGGLSSDPFAATREEQQRRASELARARREQDLRSSKKQEAEIQRRREQTRKAAQKAERARRQAVAEQASAPKSPTLGPMSGHLSPPRGQHRAALHDRQALRQLLVLKELIDPPLALRGPGQ
jgi:hypothetical protein